MIIFVALSRNRLVNNLIAEGDSDSDSDGEGKKKADADDNLPSKNFAILLVEKFIYEDADKNAYLEEALRHKGNQA